MTQPQIPYYVTIARPSASRGRWVVGEGAAAAKKQQHTHTPADKNKGTIIIIINNRKGFLSEKEKTSKREQNRRWFFFFITRLRAQPPSESPSAHGGMDGGRWIPCRSVRNRTRTQNTDSGGGDGSGDSAPIGQRATNKNAKWAAGTRTAASPRRSVGDRAKTRNRRRGRPQFRVVRSASDISKHGILSVEGGDSASFGRRPSKYKIRSRRRGRPQFRAVR